MVDVVGAVLNALIDGVGADAAIAAGIAAWPFLGTPIVSQLFTWGVDQLAQVIDENANNYAIKLVIGAQSTLRKDAFNAAIQPIIQGSPTDAEIQAARAAADALIERNRP